MFKLVLLCFIIVPTLSLAAKECLGYRGKVKCQNNINSVFIQLVDEDGTSANDLMDEGYPSRVSGSFNLYGCASDPVGHIDPELHIYHKCKGGNELKKFVLSIPQTAIGQENNQSQPIDLNAPLPNESVVKKYPSSAVLCSQTTKKPKF